MTTDERGVLERIIRFAIAHRWLMLALTLVLVGVGVGADLKLTRRADLKLTRGGDGHARWPSVDNSTVCFC